ncbi:hypothetical protein BC361_24590 [Ensifer sp. LC54]|nr:hypothetical protein BC361_24590 [Ensifer sp. LC54]OCP22646.1 hypothetical protein BC363_26725 [Ensifer sp. LC384]
MSVFETRQHRFAAVPDHFVDDTILTCLAECSLKNLWILDEEETSGFGVAEVACRHDILPQQICSCRKARPDKPDRITRMLLPMALIGCRSLNGRSCWADKVAS